MTVLLIDCLLMLRQFLTVTGLSDRFYYDTISGTTDAAIVEWASAKHNPNLGIHMLFEVSLR